MGAVSNACIREALPSDREMVLDYLAQLPEGDRRLRFFGPTRLEEQVDRFLATPDGIALIAVIDDREGTQRCVAEGIAVPCGGGVSEFALSVDRERRGGLGTAMFEELRRRAGARGATTLFGDVLVGNAPMLRLLRRRGGITIERKTPDVIGIVVGTGHGPPPWSPRPVGRRVLVEASGGHWHGEDTLRAAGYDVAVCAGPEDRAPDVPCPMLADGACSLVEGADVIVHLLPPDRPENRRVAAALARGRSGAAVLTPETDESRATVTAAAVLQAFVERRTPGFR